MASLNKWAYWGFLAITLGIKISIISFLILANIVGSSAKSSCCVETTMASMRTGLLSSEYSKVNEGLSVYTVSEKLSLIE